MSNLYSIPETIKPNTSHINSFEIDTRVIGLLLEDAASRSKPEHHRIKRFTEVHERMTSLIALFNENHRELMCTEMRILNLNSTANAIQEKHRIIEKVSRRLEQQLKEAVT